MPSVLYTAVLSLPILGYFGVGAREWYLPHPIQGPLELLRIETSSTSDGLAYAIGYPLLWIVPMSSGAAAPCAGCEADDDGRRVPIARRHRCPQRGARLDAALDCVFTPAFGLLFRFAGTAGRRHAARSGSGSISSPTTRC